MYVYVYIYISTIKSTERQIKKSRLASSATTMVMAFDRYVSRLCSGSRETLIKVTGL